MHPKKHQRDRVSNLVLWGHWYAFVNMVLAMLIGTRYIATEGLPESLIGQGYMLLNLIGHFSFLGFVVYLVILFPVTLLMPFSGFLRGFAALIATISLSALAFDSVIFDQYRLHLNPLLLDIAGRDAAKILTSPLLLGLPVAIFAFQLTLANALWKRLDNLSRINVGGKIAGILLVCFVSSHLIHIWADAAAYRPVTAQDDMYPLHYPATARSFITKQGLLDQENIAEAERQAAPTKQLMYPLAPLQCQATETPDILFIVVNSLRLDMINQTTMPYLTSMRSQSQWYPQHYSGSNEYQFGMYSLLYGMLPGYYPYLEADKKPPVLMQQLQQAGYQLNLFGDQKLSASPEAAGILSGFNVHEVGTIDEMAEHDQATTSRVLGHINRAQSPQFSLVTYHAPAHYSTPIGSVGIPTVRPTMELNDAERVLFNQYRQSLRFIDNELKQLLSKVDPTTLVMITGSHGQVFTTSADARRNFSDGAVKVPLLIRWDKTDNRRIPHQSSHFGIAPMVLTKVLNCATSATDYSIGEVLDQPSSTSFLVSANHRLFAVRSEKRIAVVDKDGDYRVYDKDYQRQRHATVDVQILLDMMEEGRRFLAR